MTAVFIVGAARTPIGSFQGTLAEVSAPKLGAAAIREALLRAQVAPNTVDEIYMGNVLTAGVGQAPARQAAKLAGLPDSVPAVTVGKVCGSGLQAAVFGAKSIKLGEANVVVAGGMESMSQAPYLLPQARSGMRMGHGEVKDSMILDGLWDPYNNWHMGNAGELCAKEWDFTRAAQDQFAAESYRSALAAKERRARQAEIVSVVIEGKKESVTVTDDEEPGRVKFDKITGLRPAFDKAGTITAANASKINDGGAALVLASESAVNNSKLQPLARVVAYASFAHAPEWFTTAPVHAIENCLKLAGLTADDIDLYEINEAFAVVPMAAMKKLNIPRAKVNIRGGAIALGHPIGASGARIVTTLCYALADEKKRYGLATLCIGGGEALAMIIERV